MNLSKKSFFGILILFFVLGLLYHPADEAKAGVPITVLMRANGSSSNLTVAPGTKVKITWDSSGDSGRTCTTNFNSSTLQKTDSLTGYEHTAGALGTSKTFTVTCTNAPCVPGRAVFSTTGSGTWTAPPSIENCKVVVTGLAGGAGGKGGEGSNSTYNDSAKGGYGGGAGGIFARIYNDPNYLGAVYQMSEGDVLEFSVGAGGAGGAGGDQAVIENGTDGGQTWITKNGSLVGRAYGGHYSNGGTTQSITTNINNYWDLDGGGGEVVIGSSASGQGGSAIYGSGWNTLTSYMGVGGLGGDKGAWKQSGSDGLVGGNYGAGGGGGGAAGNVDSICFSSCSHAGGDGGNGAGGLVIVDWFGVGADR